MKRIRVAVTGAGSGVGNGIVKALRLSELPVDVICTDIAPRSVGLFRADEAEIWPAVEEAGALDRIVERLRTLRVDALMIGSEFDLAFYAAHRSHIEANSDCVVIVSPPEVISVANDKWDTVQFLQRNGIAHPRSALPETRADALEHAEAWGYPVVLKPRVGTSGRGVHVVADAADMERQFIPKSGQMLQEHLGDRAKRRDNEYTCSVFRLDDGTLLGPLTARRRLRGGDSWQVEVDSFADLFPIMDEIGRHLPSRGSLNVQLFLTGDGPVPFEINARFSGTTAIRAHFGFNEPEMAIRHYVLGEPLSQPAIGRGIALRYMEEVFLDGLGAEDLSPPFPQGQVHQWF